MSSPGHCYGDLTAAMNPDTPDTMFRGISRDPKRGPSSFFTSLCGHVAVIALLLLASPKIAWRNSNSNLHTTLIAPFEKPAVPERTPRRVITEVAAAPRILRQLPIPAEPRVVLPKLDESPALPNVPRPAVVLPSLVPVAVIRPPVQTGLFGSDSPPKVDTTLPVPSAREAGFDPVAKQAPVAPQAPSAAAAGFDVRSTDSRRTTTAAVQTGAFGQTPAGKPRSARLLAANVGHTAFDVRPENERPATLDQMVRKTAFDEPKAAPAAVKMAAPAAAVRPVEILDKPRPAYTAEARSQRIEGSVLLDVIFAASGEVRVLGVVRGLGHGLDENAVDAARRIRFTPAMQAGIPVDQHVVLHVVFQITG